MSRRAAAVLARDNARDDLNKHDRLRERLMEEQNYLRVRRAVGGRTETCCGNGGELCWVMGPFALAVSDMF